MKLKTSYDPKPIPDRRYDWLCYDEDTYDGPGCPVGVGATEAEAIEDFVGQIDRRLPAGVVDE